MACSGEGRNHRGLVPLSMQSLTNQILTGLLQNKMFAFHQAIRMEQLNQHRDKFYLGNLWKSKDREMVKERKDHRGSLGWIYAMFSSDVAISLLQCPPVLKRACLGCRKSTGRQSRHTWGVQRTSLVCCLMRFEMGLVLSVFKMPSYSQEISLWILSGSLQKWPFSHMRVWKAEGSWFSNHAT